MKQGILLAAYGSSNVQGETALKLFDAEVRRRFPHIPVRWAFTSLLLRERLAAARVKKDSVCKALQKMHFEQYTHVAVQPLQIIPGKEYAEVLQEVELVQSLRHKGRGMHISVGTPLLMTDEDVLKTAKAIISHIPHERRVNEAVVLMGHGAQHEAVHRYSDLAQAVYALDAHVHVGAMHGAVTLEYILPQLLPQSTVWLMPLLSVVGRHALDDMAGKSKSSWRTRIENCGCECRPVLKGTAEYAGFVDIWLLHLATAMNNVAHSKI